MPGFERVSITIPQSDLDALGDVPVLLVAAPGAGKYISPKTIDASFTGARNYQPFGDVALAAGEVFAPSNPLLNAVSGGSDGDADTVSFGPVFNDADPWVAAGAEMENQALVIACNGSMLGGTVTAYEVAAGGTGYAPGDTGNVIALGSDYTVDGVDGDGAVTALTLTPATRGLAGSTYDTAVTSGGGNGALTILVTSVETGEGSLRVTLYYTTENL